MEFLGTSGDWYVDSMDDTFIRSCENKATIAVMSGANWVYNESRANAVLISQSPNMFKFILSLIEDGKLKKDDELIANNILTKATTI